MYEKNFLPQTHLSSINSTTKKPSSSTVWKDAYDRGCKLPHSVYAVIVLILLSILDWK